MSKKVILFCWVVSMLGDASACDDNSEIIKTLSERVSDEQIKRTQLYKDITHMEEIEGLYRSYVHINLHGPEEYALIRRDVSLIDNPSFTSGIVVQQILDAYRFGNAPIPSRDDINKVVKLYADGHDKNTDYENSIIPFYLQTYNPDRDDWESYSNNIIKIMQQTSNLPEALGQMIANLFLGPGDAPNGLEYVYHPKHLSGWFVPPDFDCTFAHLAFGATLFQLRDTYPDSWTAWKAKNTNLTSIFDALKTCAYRPFSDDRSENTIDTRSYFVMRDYLDKSKTEGRDLALITTWTMTVDMEITEPTKLPMGVNIIDMAVTANVLTGIFSALDTGLIEPDTVTKDDDLKLIIDSSASLLLYNLQNNFTGRPDLAYGYYPSTQQFYSFVSKGLMYMENAKLKGTLHKIPVYEKYYNGLSDVMRKTVTRKILSDRKTEQDGTSFYYDGFLGAADLSYDGKPINRAEDRYYTTSMAATSLIYTWSVYDEGLGALRWIDSVPDEVKATVYGLSRWIVMNPFGGNYGVRNCFYGVAIINRETLIFWYPANRYEYFNGTKINDFNGPVKAERVLLGMEGYVNPDVYKKMLAVDQFGQETPMDFHGPNSGHGAGIFWSVDAVSYAGAMMTLSMTDALQKSENFVCENV